MNRIIHASSAWALVSTIAAAQADVFVVDENGGGNFANIQSAVNAADNGDTLLVKGGTYQDIIIDGKSLFVIAEMGAKVRVFGAGVGNDVVSVRNLAAGQHVVIRGIEVAPAAPTVERPIHIENNLGQVWLEDVRVTPAKEQFVFDANPNPDAMVVVENSKTVALTRCQVKGSDGVISTTIGLGLPQVGTLGADALRAENSMLSVWDSTLTGGRGSDATFGPTDAPIFATDGGDGIEVAGGEMFLSNCAVIGGQGGGANQVFWGCLDAANGGDGLLLDTGNPKVRARGSEFNGGAAGPAGVCSPSGTPGQDVLVVTGSYAVVGDDARSMVVTGPHREGETATLSHSGQSGELVFHAVGAVQSHFELLSLGGVLVTIPITLTLAGTVDNTGLLVTTSHIPVFGNPAREAAHVYVQPLFVDVSTVVAPIVTLGSGSVLSMLDASF